MPPRLGRPQFRRYEPPHPFVRGLIVFADLLPYVRGWLLHARAVDALREFMGRFDAENPAFQSWDTTMATPCTWFHVTCGQGNQQVVRL